MGPFAGPGSNGTVTIKGEAFYAAAQNVHTGVIDAKAKPERDLLQFADDGSAAFDAPDVEARCACSASTRCSSSRTTTIAAASW